MALLLSVVLSATPMTCDELWLQVWEAYSRKEPQRGPLFEKLPDAKERLAKAWIAECGRFSGQQLDCLRGVERDRDLAKLRRELLAKKELPVEEVDRLLAQMRAEWTVFDCADVNRSLDRAAAVVAKDAGLTR